MRTFLLIASALTLPACHSQLQPPAERLAGTWSSTYDGTVIQMMAEDDTHGAYVVRAADEPMQLIAGSYTATETHIVFNDETGPCEGTAGRYEFAILSTSMQFDRLDDDCTGRDDIVTGGAWVRVFAADPKTDADSDRR